MRAKTVSAVAFYAMLALTYGTGFTKIFGVLSGFAPPARFDSCCSVVALANGGKFEIVRHGLEDPQELIWQPF
jgi:hypothetical protein